MEKVISVELTEDELLFLLDGLIGDIWKLEATKGHIAEYPYLGRKKLEEKLWKIKETEFPELTSIGA